MPEIKRARLGPAGSTMTIKRYRSEQELFDELLLRRVPEPPPPPPDYETNVAISVRAQEIIEAFESPKRTPNYVLFRPFDEKLSAADWRKAAIMAGRLIERRITVHRNKDGKVFAMLELTPDEEDAESERATQVLDAVMTGQPKPPPLPRKLR